MSAGASAARKSEVRLNVLLLTVVLGALTAFSPFATDMYLSSFPAIAQSLDTTVAHVQYSVSSYFLGLAIGQLCYGPVIDRFGRKIPLIIGVALFALASVALIFSPEINTFIGLRFIQACGGCAGMIISRAIIQDLFRGNEGAEVLSAMMMVQGVGPIAAPVLGAYILTWASWHAVFWFLAVFAAFCLLLTIFYIPETLKPENRLRQTPAEILSVFRELLFKPSFLIPALGGSLSLSVMFAFIAGSPVVFMEGFGLSSRAYGWVFGVFAVGMVCSGQLNRMLLRRFSARQLLYGVMLAGLVSSLLALVVAGSDSIWLLSVPLFFCIATVPSVGANSTALAMTASGRYAGSASSLVGVMQFSCGALMTALVSAMHDGTAWPMVMMMVVAGVLGNLMIWAGRRASQPAEAD